LEVRALEPRTESTGEVPYFNLRGWFDVVAFTLKDPLLVLEEIRSIDESMKPLLVVSVKFVVLQAGSLRRPTLAVIGAFEVYNSSDADALKKPEIGPFEVTNLA